MRWSLPLCGKLHKRENSNVGDSLSVKWRRAVMEEHVTVSMVEDIYGIAERYPLTVLLV